MYKLFRGIANYDFKHLLALKYSTYVAYVAKSFAYIKMYYIVIILL